MKFITTPIATVRVAFIAFVVIFAFTVAFILVSAFLTKQKLNSVADGKSDFMAIAELQKNLKALKKTPFCSVKASKESIAKPTLQIVFAGIFGGKAVASPTASVSDKSAEAENTGNNGEKSVAGETNSNSVTSNNSTDKTGNLAGDNAPSFYAEPFSSQNDEASNSNYLYLLFRMFLVLGAFLLLAFVIFRVLRSRNQQIMDSNPLFRVVADFPVSVHCKLTVMRIVKDYHVFIIGKESATHVQQVVDKESIDEIKLLENQTGTGNINFFKDFLGSYQKMQKMMGRKKMNSNVDADSIASSAGGAGSAKMSFDASSRRVRDSLSVTQALEKKMKNGRLNKY